MSHLAALVLAWMLFLQPRAPWRATYQATAVAIADVVEHESPLFEGARGRERTAALLVSLAWYESRFDAGATGDHGRAHGLYQIHGHGELGDVGDATRAALELVRASFRACHSRPVDERLGLYASRPVHACDVGPGPLRASRHRFATARWIVAHVDASGSGS